MSDGVKVWTFRVAATIAAACWLWWGYDVLTGRNGPAAAVAWVSLGVLGVVGWWSYDARMSEEDTARAMQESRTIEDVLALLAALGMSVAAVLAGLSGLVGGEGTGLRAGRLALAVVGAVGAGAVLSAAGIIARRPVASRLVAAGAVVAILAYWAGSRLSEGLPAGEALVVLLPFLVVVVLPLLLSARRLSRSGSDDVTTSSAPGAALRRT